MENETVSLNDEDLKQLDEQFKDLVGKIKAGEYIVVAKSEGGFTRKEEVYYSDRINSYDDTTLTVDIAPSPSNVGSSIKSMAFEFKHAVSHTGGSFSHCMSGQIRHTFRIETAEGKIYSYGPEWKDVYEEPSSLLDGMLQWGRRTVEAERGRKAQEEYEFQKKAEQDAQAQRSAQIKNDLKL